MPRRVLIVALVVAALVGASVAEAAVTLKRGTYSGKLSGGGTIALSVGGVTDGPVQTCLMYGTAVYAP